jgi:hypothetical protein
VGSKFDYYSPFFRAAIITDPKNRSATRFPLWVFGSPEESKKMSQKSEVNGLSSLAYCTDISVRLHLGYIPEVTATLNPPIVDARRFIESPLVEWTQSVLEVMFGYTNGPNYTVLSPTYEGMIQQPEVSLGTDASVTLRAIGHGASMAVKEEVSKIFNKTSRLDMIKDVLSPYGLDVDASGVKGAEKTALDEKPETTFGANTSAWFFALQQAKTCHCWLYLENTTVKIIPIDAALGAAPQFKFTYYDQRGKGTISPQDDDFPILGFSTSTPAVYLAGATKALRLHSYDSKTREVKTDGEVSDAKTAPKRTGDGQVDVKDAPSEGEFFPANTADPEMKKKAEAAFRAASSGMGVQVEIETLGIPNIVPGMLFSVSGVAKDRLDGNYAVFEVVHNIGSGGYTTKVTGVSNVGQLSAKLGFGTAPANPNTQVKNSPTAPTSTTNNTTVKVEAKVDTETLVTNIQRLVRFGF